MDEELCACIIDWQKAFDHVNWAKLMQILKETDIKWSERKMIRKFYMDQSVKSMTGLRV
jgi:hypothetical protein